MKLTPETKTVLSTDEEKKIIEEIIKKIERQINLLSDSKTK